MQSVDVGAGLNNVIKAIVDTLIKTYECVTEGVR